MNMAVFWKRFYPRETWKMVTSERLLTASSIKLIKIALASLSCYRKIKIQQTLNKRKIENRFFDFGENVFLMLLVFYHIIAARYFIPIKHLIALSKSFRKKPQMKNNILLKL